MMGLERWDARPRTAVEEVRHARQFDLEPSDELLERAFDEEYRRGRREALETAGLRITDGQIREALAALGPPGDRAEAYIRAAAEGMARILAATPDHEHSPQVFAGPHISGEAVVCSSCGRLL